MSALRWAKVAQLMGDFIRAHITQQSFSRQIFAPVGGWIPGVPRDNTEGNW